jgi:hypothetical protein
LGDFPSRPESGHAPNDTVDRLAGHRHDYWHHPLVHTLARPIRRGVNTGRLWPGRRSAGLRSIHATGRFPRLDALPAVGSRVSPTGTSTAGPTGDDNSASSTDRPSQGSAAGSRRGAATGRSCCFRAGRCAIAARTGDSSRYVHAQSSCRSRS